MVFGCDYCQRADAPDYDEVVDGITGIVKSACPDCSWNMKTNTCYLCKNLFEVEEFFTESFCFNCKEKTL